MSARVSGGQATRRAKVSAGRKPTAGLKAPADRKGAAGRKSAAARKTTAGPKATTPRPPASERRRAAAILRRLERAYPDWGPTLDFSTPLELLVATILAAQARDERINEITRSLFRRYRTPEDYVRAPQAQLERDIKSSGFFRNKAKAIKGACQGIIEEFGGKVPGRMDDLVRLRGVGRKTASIVLGAAFKVPAVAVDRHVARVATRLDIPRGPGPDRIESGLRATYPERDWVKVTWTFILHGRRTCMPTPACPRCPVNALCPYPNKTG